MCVLIKPSINLRPLAPNVSEKTKKIKSLPLELQKAETGPIPGPVASRRVTATRCLVVPERQTGICVNDAISARVDDTVWLSGSASVRLLHSILQEDSSSTGNIKALKLGNC